MSIESRCDRIFRVSDESKGRLRDIETEEALDSFDQARYRPCLCDRRCEANLSRRPAGSEIRASRISPFLRTKDDRSRLGSVLVILIE